jgi:hypothetical protein
LVSRARDNIQSSRSRDDIDRDAAVRSETQRLRLELLHTQDAEKFQAIQQRMAEIALDKRTPVKTAVQAGAAHQRAVIGLVQNPPQVTINQGAVLDAASLLRLVAPEEAGHTTGWGPALPTTADPAPLLRATASDPSENLGLRVPAVPDTSEPTDGPPARVRSGGGPEATPPALRAPEYLRCARCGARTDDEPHACPVPEEPDAK